MDDLRRLRSRSGPPPPPDSMVSYPAKLARVTAASRNDTAFTPAIAAYVLGREVEGGTVSITDGTNSERFLVAPLNGAFSQNDYLPAGWGDYRWSGRRAAGEPPPGTLTVRLTGYCPDTSPIPGVTVTATKGDDTETDVTGSDGRVVLPTHGTGYYSITLEKSGYSKRVFPSWFVDGSSTLNTYLLPSTVNLYFYCRTLCPVPFPGVQVTLYGETMEDVIGTGTSGSDGGLTITVDRADGQDTIPFAGGTYEPPAGHGAVGGNIILGTQYLLCDIGVPFPLSIVSGHDSDHIGWCTAPWPGYFPKLLQYEDAYGSCQLDWSGPPDNWFIGHYTQTYTTTLGEQSHTITITLDSSYLSRWFGSDRDMQPWGPSESGPSISGTVNYVDILASWPPEYRAPWPPTGTVTGTV